MFLRSLPRGGVVNMLAPPKNVTSVKLFLHCCGHLTTSRRRVAALVGRRAAVRIENGQLLRCSNTREGLISRQGDCQLSLQCIAYPHIQNNVYTVHLHDE
jgi:hypothetical protein